MIACVLCVEVMESFNRLLKYNFRFIQKKQKNKKTKTKTEQNKTKTKQNKTTETPRNSDPVAEI